MLKVAKDLIGWDKWQAERTKAQAEGRWLGIGIGTTLDSGTNNFGQSQIVNPQAPFSGNSQAASAKLDIYGEVIVAVGSVPQGQGHETTVSQVVADILNIRPGPGECAGRLRHRAQRPHRTQRDIRQPVRGIGPVRGKWRGAATEGRDEEARGVCLAVIGRRHGVWYRQARSGSPRAWDEKAIPYIGLANLANVNTAVVPEELRYDSRSTAATPGVRLSRFPTCRRNTATSR